MLLEASFRADIILLDELLRTRFGPKGSSTCIGCNGILDMSRYGLGGPGILDPLELRQLAPQMRQLPMSKAKTICN